MGSPKIASPVESPQIARAQLRDLLGAESTTFWIKVFDGAKALVAYAEVARRARNFVPDVEELAKRQAAVARRHGPLGEALFAEPTVVHGWEELKILGLQAWTDMPDWITPTIFSPEAVRFLDEIHPEVHIAVTRLSRDLVEGRQGPNLGIVAATLVELIASAQGRELPKSIELALLAVAAEFPGEPPDSPGRPVDWRARADEWRHRVRLAKKRSDDRR